MAGPSGRGGRALDPDRLRCPACGTTYPGDERFCPDCKLPLVQADGPEVEEVSERHERARKIKPQYTEGPPVRVAGARNQAEAEFIQGLLLEEGIPSMLRRTAGFDVPDFLAAGPRDVMVPEAARAAAREVLLQGELISDEPATRVVSPGPLLIGLLIALAIGALLVWLLSQV
jgi:Putative prokaryotic signal transducing protein